ncbi:hypothetical protein M433DRAFT_133809 [Acidomyces richmondensis BFW]|nr:MAG: hypothetical protein FE78DRAFT_69799 [Acidomyces sp. 'richmondensis']KYG46511.1 hypothetical protein M433DRAFT_133809 [Acidomyces richmondensis BFW]
MADFITNLWTSVFTPGATPTLLLATNVTFGALQALLLGLLIATYSIHFAILSILSAGLWYSINWFARELKAAQAKEEEAERLRKQKPAVKSDKEWKSSGEEGDSADDEGEDTETEGAGMRESTSSMSLESKTAEEEMRQGIINAMQPSLHATKTGISASTGSQAIGPEGTSRKRKIDDGDRSGEISTDSEWEKVEDDR